MKKVLFAVACALVMVSCDQFGKKEDSPEKLRADSLERVLAQERGEQDALWNSINEIENGLNEISEAEGRIRQLRESGAEVNALEALREDMQFIESKMAENRQKIEELQRELAKSGKLSSELKNKLTLLTKQLEERDTEIKALRQELEAKNVRIEELDESVSQLQDENTRVKEENERVRQESENNAQIAREQDTQLNTAWYVYGTTRELKEHRILDSGEVLQNKDFDKNYFTRIDIRQTTVIPLSSRHVKILTTHPADSYSMMKDARGEYTLRIDDAYRFWSVSKYLVIRVK